MREDRILVRTFVPDRKVQIHILLMWKDNYDLLYLV
jgi:hypothetical protein